MYRKFLINYGKNMNKSYNKFKSIKFIIFLNSEFNEKLVDNNSQQVTNSELENIIKLTGDDATANLAAIDTLIKLIYWPKGKKSLKKIISYMLLFLCYFSINRYVISGS